VTLAQLADTDPLTGLANRRRLDHSLTSLYSSSRRHQFDISALVIDIDNFKRVNDQFGHPCGDRVLKMVADSLRSYLRLEDVGARWGGEEFVVILPHTNLKGAVLVAERIRILVASNSVPGPDDVMVAVTVSVGVASTSDGVKQEDLIEVADANLYLAKQSGRNRVACGGGTEPARVNDPVAALESELALEASDERAAHSVLPPSNPQESSTS
jgi:diguanylate cyclase (GGDEF)-like protein